MKYAVAPEFLITKPSFVCGAKRGSLTLNDLCEEEDQVQLYWRAADDDQTSLTMIGAMVILGLKCVPLSLTQIPAKGIVAALFLLAQRRYYWSSCASLHVRKTSFENSTSDI